MSFTPLQELVIFHARDIVTKLEDQVHVVARNYNFTCSTRQTPEHDLMQSVRDLQDIINALLKEQK